MRRSPMKQRRGLATVEMAVCLPMLVLLVFGAIEASSYIFLKQSLNVAAYEGVREAARVGGADASARSRAENILTARGIQNFRVTFPAGSIANADRGELIRVQVSAPAADNSPLAGSWVPSRNLSSTVTMVKE